MILITWTLYRFKGRKEMAQAIIGLLMFFYNSKIFNCIGALSFFNICLHFFDQIVIEKSNSGTDFNHAGVERKAKRVV